MKRVPVIIITLCRYEHFKRCVESLAANKLAEETELYIGLDYPAYESHKEGYKRIEAYLNTGISGFKKVNIIKQSDNQGVYNNFLSVRETVYQKYDRYIYSEDDNEFSVNYLEYMNRCMNQYEKYEDVLAVAGYAYPIRTDQINGNVYSINTYFTALGYGIWKNKEIAMYKRLNLDIFSEYFSSQKMRQLRESAPNQYCNFVKGMLGYTPDLIDNAGIRKTDLALGLYMYFEGKRMVFPKLSKVRNWGYDGSGTNCSEIYYEKSEKTTYHNYDFSKQLIDTAGSFDRIDESSIGYDAVNKLLKKYFYVGIYEKIRTRFAFMLTNVIGVDKMRCLLKKGKGRK